MPDKYKAVWVSHSKIADFLKCPRLFYLRHIYKDPRTGHKITVVTPPLALGSAVHETLESLSIIPLEDRFTVSPLKKLDLAWEKITGKKGGFKSQAEEKEYKQSATDMIKKIIKNPGPLGKKAVKAKTDDGLAWYWLSEEDNIILSGKIDWLEYLEESDSIHIIDFKTGKNEEDEDSLQLPIYYLLATNLQKRPIKKASYWYLYKSDAPVEVTLPELNEANQKVYDLAKRIKLGIQINRLRCPHDGCFACRPLEEAVSGKGQLVGLSDYKQDIYVL